MAVSLGAVISGLTAATMVAVGMELHFASIPGLARRNAALPVLLLTQMFLLPALAVLVVWAVPMPQETRFVVLMLAACPTGNVANFFTLLARGNLALSVSASALSCLLAPAVLPVTFAFYRNFYGREFPFTVPQGVLVLRVVVLTWLPILFGVALRRFLANRTTAFSVWFRNACAGGVVILCIFIGVTRFRDLATDLRTNLVVSATLVGLAIVVAITIAISFRLPPDNAVCFVTAFPARHIGVLATLTVATLRRFDDLVFLLVYFVLESAMILTFVTVYRGRRSLPTVST